jgi:K+-transporting ATPase ATPase C chain
MKTQIIPALKFLIIMTILTGIVYPLLMTGIAQVFYPSKSNGSLIIRNGKAIGSVLIGQKSDSSIYFWSRPSSVDYNPIPSGASNLGPISDTLKKQVLARREIFAKMNSVKDPLSVPKEMIFASGSGLDPHISPEAALMQVDRVSAARHFTAEQKVKLLEVVRKLKEPSQLHLFGEERTNVLSLNIELDKIQ